MLVLILSVLLNYNFKKSKLLNSDGFFLCIKFRIAILASNGFMSIFGFDLMFITIVISNIV